MRHVMYTGNIRNKIINTPEPVPQLVEHCPLGP